MQVKTFSMQMNWIQNGLLILLAALFINGMAHADQAASEQTPQESTFQQSNSENETNVAECAPKNYCEPQNLCCCEPDVRLLSHLPCVDGFTAHVDFLYWKADEDGLEFGTKMLADPIIGHSSTTKQRLLDLHFNWDPGFRVGIGYLFKDYDHWAVNLNWTHIHNFAHGKSHANGQSSQVGTVDTIVSPWVNLLFELRFGASKAKAHWHVYYDTLDLDFGRSVSLSKRFVLNPFFGVRAAWINQNYHAEYNSKFVLMESSPRFFREVTFKAKNHFFGFGLRAGTELMWRLTKDWHLFSQVAGHILYGKFKVKMKNLHDQGLGEGSVPPSPLNFFASEHLKRTRLNFEEAIGLGWEKFFCCNRYHLMMRASYQFSQWINQNELFTTFYFRGQDTLSNFPVRSQGDLSFQGVQLSAQFDF